MLVLTFDGSNTWIEEHRAVGHSRGCGGSNFCASFFAGVLGEGAGLTSSPRVEIL